MANLRNFINAIANDNRIYTAEDIGKMTNKEFMANEKAIDYQMANLGIPRESELTGNPDVVYVHAYTRDDGTEVRAHYRSKPDGGSWHGVIYDKNSGFSKRLSNSPELRTQIMSKYDKKSKKFTTNQIGIGFSEDKNLNYSIGHGTILNPRIENGEFRGILFDKYDYKWLSKEELPNLETRKLNNSAYTLQTIKQLTNYYVIIPVQFKLRGY